MGLVNKLTPLAIVLAGVIVSAALSVGLDQLNRPAASSAEPMITSRRPARTEANSQVAASTAPQLSAGAAANAAPVNRTQAPAAAPAIAASVQPVSAAAAAQIAVSVSIDGAAVFVVNLDEGKNQCDVLTQALRNGQITSLDMPYNASLGSFGVEQINGLGRSGQVWWAYKVNGKSPPYGCSHVVARNQDGVKWTYVGPR
jgi:hypothetical protein